MLVVGRVRLGHAWILTQEPPPHVKGVVVFILAAAVSMWRSYWDDPMLLTDGGSFVWRNGDTSDPATGIKCSVQTGGNPAGDPQAANVQTISFSYAIAN